MNQILILIGIVAVYLLLTRFVLPKAGVPT
jgi:hypothetical protein